MSLRRLSQGVGAGAADKVIVTLVQLLMVPVLVNAWGLVLFGIWAMVSTVPQFLVLSDFGIVASAWSRMTRFVSRGETDRARAVLHTAWAVMSGICVVLLALVAVVVVVLPDGILPVAARFDEFEARATILLLTAYGLGTIVFRLNAVVFRASGHFPLSSWCSTLSYAIENFALIAAVLLGAGPLEATASLLGARLVSLLSIYLLGQVRLPHLRPGVSAARRSEWTELWPPALQALVLGIGFLFFLQASVVTLGTVAGAAALPAFVAVRTISRIGVQASQLVAQPAAQEFSHHMARGDGLRAGRYFGLVAGVSVVIALAMAVGLVALGQWAIEVWTAGAIRAPLGLLAAMAISSFAAILWNPLANLVISVGQQKAIAYTTIAAGTIGLALIALTGSELGALAAGIGFAVFDAATAAAALLFIRREWLVDPDFRRGTMEALRGLSSPAATWRSLRGT